MSRGMGHGAWSMGGYHRHTWPGVCSRVTLRVAAGRGA
jgi:hypothetical protein